MTPLFAIVNAATLKGYLVATDAPKEMIALASQIVDEGVESMRGGAEIGIEEYKPIVALPIAAIEKNAQAVIAALDAALAEEEAETPVADEAEVKDALVTTGGALEAIPIKRKGKTSKLEASMLPDIQNALAEKSFGEVGFIYGVSGTTIRNFLMGLDVDPTAYCKPADWRWKREGFPKAVQAEPVVQQPKADDEVAQMSYEPAALTAPAKVATRMNPTARGKNPDNVWEEWQLETLGKRKAEGLPASKIAAELNKTAMQVSNKWTWLQKQAAPKTATPAATSTDDLDDDGWPKAAKPETATVPSPAPVRPEAKPVNKFKTITTRDSWGHEKEIQVMEPLSEGKDPESGAKVTKYPSAYAIGAYPQRNVGGKS